jgi:hypothetical protein
VSAYTGKEPADSEGRQPGYPIIIDRLNPTTGNAQVPTNDYRWFITSGDKTGSFKLDNFRHFTVAKGGVFKVTFEDLDQCPAEFPPAQFWDGCKGPATVPWAKDTRKVGSMLQFNVLNIRQPTDYAILNVPRPSSATGTGTLKVLFSTSGGGGFTTPAYVQAVTPITASNLAGALAQLHDPNVHFKFYDDGSRVWIKLEQYNMKFFDPIKPDSWLLDTVLAVRIYFE